uniref:Helicase C-terminal domain-containing protein n=1 Tax=Hymenolepis diminuta TaxID=6216 RepID=A0A0R3SFJ4_HYMDI
LNVFLYRRRVVLTGYPLQNNLMEYWCMVDFVRPNYLGSKAEFTNMFQRPIENGQCVDSTEADRKLMQGRAHVLHGLLSGFVQRRSHAVLKASLPPKQEVVLMVRMSPLQRRLYTALMNYISTTSNSYGSGLPTANTLQTYALCCKIWNHPDILWRVVQENVDETLDFEMDDPTNSVNGTTTPRVKRKANGSNSVTNPTGEDKYAWLTHDLWGENFRAGDVQNSGKLILFLSLLWESVHAGDKMLLFSQSLLTLDLIERLLGKLPLDSERPPSPSQTQASQEQLQQQRLEEEEETEKTLHYRFNRRLGNDPSKQPQVWVRNVHYFRLDGSTSATDRDRLIRRFNDSANPVKLFLVSTRAGSLGVNLIGANRVVVFDASWNPCHDCQAVCRVYRYGQEKPCFIYRLVSDNTMERKIYDRQINKQGVSDRVVDEMNPGQQFTRAQVGVLMAYEDKDMPVVSDEDLKSISEITDSDPVLKATLERNEEWITMKPFTHESLLIDRKDYRLTRVEKRIAYQRYQQERINSANIHGTGRSMSALHYQMMAAAAASGVQFNPYSGNIGPVGFNYPATQGRGMPNILSKSGGINMMHQGAYGATTPYGFFSTGIEDPLAAARRYDGIQRNRMLQKDLDEARIRAVSREIGITLPSGPLGSDYKITRVAASTDLVFPQSTHPPAPERSIPKGEVVEIIQAGPNGKYLRLPRTGDIYVVKPGASSTSVVNDPNPGRSPNVNNGTAVQQLHQNQQAQSPQPQQPVQIQMNQISGENVSQQVSTSHPSNPSQSSLCSRCRHPTVPSGCLCSSQHQQQQMYSTNQHQVSNAPATQMPYHPPTYTNQYALPITPYVSSPPPNSSTNTPTSHGYPNY